MRGTQAAPLDCPRHTSRHVAVPALRGHHPSPFDMPIYDDLFVVGCGTVCCIPDDLEPAG